MDAYIKQGLARANAHYYLGKLGLQDYGVALVALVVASCVHNLFGFVYYTHLASKTWVRALCVDKGKNEKQLFSYMRDHGYIPLNGLMGLFTIATSLVFGLMAYAYYELVQIQTFESFYKGLLLYQALIVVPYLHHCLWEARPMKLILINVIYDLVSSVIFLTTLYVLNVHVYRREASFFHALFNNALSGHDL